MSAQIDRTLKRRPSRWPGEGSGPGLPFALSILDLAVLALGLPWVLFPQMFPLAVLWIWSGLGLFLVLVRKLTIGFFPAPQPLVLWPGLCAILLLLPVALVASAHQDSALAALPRVFWSLFLFYTMLHWDWLPVDRPRQRPPAAAGGSLPATALVPTLLYCAWGVGLVVTALFRLLPAPREPYLRLIQKQGLNLYVGVFGMEPASTLNPNQLAGLLLLLTPVLMALFLLALQYRSLANWGAAVLWGSGVLVCLVLLQAMHSRGALLALGLAGGGVLATYGRTSRRIVILLMWGLLAYGLWLGLLNWLIADRRAGPAPWLQAATMLREDPGLQGRLMIWQRALYALRESPWTGIGLDAFGQVALQPFPALPGFRPDPDIGYAHNQYLQTGLDVGLGGLLAYCGLVYGAGASLWNASRCPERPLALRLWSAGLLMALLAYLLWSLVDAIPMGRLEFSMFWFLLALGFRMALDAPQGNPP